jgi:repressor LexA
MKLTDRQQEVLDFIRDFVDVKGYPPTLREIGQHFGIQSPNGVAYHLVALEKKGYIERGVSSARTIRLLDKIPSSPGATPPV